MTFASGFAQGFIDADNKRQDHKYEQQDIKLKYSLENLMKERDFRRQKAYEEAKWQSQAHMLAHNVGDDGAADYIYGLLASGIDGNTIVEKFADGSITPNKDYKAPAQTVEVQPGNPSHVDENTPKPAADPNTGYTDPTVAAPNAEPAPAAVGTDSSTAPAVTNPTDGKSSDRDSPGVMNAPADAPTQQTADAVGDGTTVADASGSIAVPPAGNATITPKSSTGLVTPPEVSQAAPAVAAKTPAPVTEPVVPTEQGDTSNPTAAAPKAPAVPKAVSAPKAAIAPAPNSTTATKKVAQAPQTELYSTGDPAQDAALDKLDPSLRKMPTFTKPQIPQNQPNSKYTWGMKNYRNLQDGPTLINNLNQAKLSKDPLRIQKAQQELDAHQQDAIFQSQLQYHGSGKDIGTYYLLNKDGSINTQFTGQTTVDGKLLDITHGAPKQITGNIIKMEPEDVTALAQLRQGLSEPAGKLGIAQSYYIGALEAAKRIEDITNDPTTRDAGFKYGGGLNQALQTIAGEVHSVGDTWKSLTELQTKVTQDSKSNDLDSLSKDANEYNQKATNMIQDLADKIAKNPHIDKVAAAHIIYEASRTQVAMNLAAARQLGSEKQPTDKSLDVQYETLGGADANPTKIIPALRNALSESYGILEGQRISLGNNPNVKFFQDTHKDINGQPMRLKLMAEDFKTGGLIAEMYKDDPARAQKLLDYLGQVQKPFDAGATQAYAGATQTGANAAAPAAPVATGSYPKTDLNSGPHVKPDESGYTPGSVYQNSDGKFYRYKGGGRKKENFEEVK